MNAKQLIKQAQESTLLLEPALRDDVILTLRLGYVARWIAQQDNTISAEAIHATAFAAIDALIIAHEMDI